MIEFSVFYGAFMVKLMNYLNDFTFWILEK